MLGAQIDRGHSRLLGHRRVRDRRRRLVARFNIGTTGARNQLPTIIHLKDGKDVEREEAPNPPTIAQWFNIPLPPKGAAGERAK
jgi:hypothetical protein